MKSVVQAHNAALFAATASLVFASRVSAEPLTKMTVQTAASADRMVAAKPVLRAESVATKKDQPAKVQIVGAATDQIEASPRAGGTSTAKPEIKVEAGKATVAISPGAQIVVRKSAPQAIVPLSTIKQALPGSVFVGVTDKDNGTVAKQLQPFIAAERLPLLWDAAAAAYVTTLFVGVDAISDNSDPAPALRDGVIFQITGRFIDRIEPSRISIQVPGPNGYQQVKLITKDFAHAIEISAHSDVGDASFSGDIDPGRFIDIGTSNERIDGLGIGAATISVLQRASNGSPFPTTDLLNIDLKTTAGQLNPSHVVIQPNGSRAEATLTSSGLGNATVSQAGASHPDASNVNVGFAFPWLKLLLGLGGAFLAGVVSTLGRKRKSSRLRVILICTATGLVIDCLLAVGAFLPWEWATKAIRSDLAWPALAFLAGFGGEPLLHRLTDWAFSWLPGGEKKNATVKA